MASILTGDNPVTINNMTTDGDSHGFMGARDAQLQRCDRQMERSADVIHLTKTMKRKIKNADFSERMFPARTKKERKYIQNRFSKDIGARVHTEYKKMHAEVPTI